MLNHDKLYYLFRSKIISGFSYFSLELTTAKPFSAFSMRHTRWFMAQETRLFLGSVNLSSITSHLWRNLAKNSCPMREFWLGPYFRWLLSTRGGICRRISGGLRRYVFAQSNKSEYQTRQIQKHLVFKWEIQIIIQKVPTTNHEVCNYFDLVSKTFINERVSKK